VGRGREGEGRRDEVHMRILFEFEMKYKLEGPA